MSALTIDGFDGARRPAGRRGRALMAGKGGSTPTLHATTTPGATAASIATSTATSIATATATSIAPAAALLPRIAGHAPRRAPWAGGGLALSVLALHVGAVLWFGSLANRPVTVMPKSLPIELALLRPPPPPVQEVVPPKPPPAQEVAPPKPPPPAARPSPPRPAPRPAAAARPAAAPTPGPTPPSDAAPATSPITVPADAAPAPVATPPGPAAVDAAPAPPAAPPAAEPVTAPRGSAGYLDNPAPAYPEVAQERGWQGRVVLKVHVSANGRPSSVGVAQSSGRKVLDDAAIKAVTAWRFMPAKRGETPIDGWVQVPLDFKL